MKNIVVVGFMGTGKSVVAKTLAEKLGREFLELDAIVEKREGLSIKEIFKNKGEVYFRELERDAVKEAIKKDGQIISAGGGAIIDEENLKALKKNGIIICLEASPDVILKRTKGNTCRPLLNVPDPKERIEELLEKRAAYYKKADHRINTDDLSVEGVVQKIQDIIS